MIGNYLNKIYFKPSSFDRLVLLSSRFDAFAEIPHFVLCEVLVKFSKEKYYFLVSVDVILLFLKSSQIILRIWEMPSWKVKYMIYSMFIIYLREYWTAATAWRSWSCPRWGPRCRSGRRWGPGGWGRCRGYTAGSTRPRRAWTQAHFNINNLFCSLGPCKDKQTLNT